MPFIFLVSLSCNLKFWETFEFAFDYCSDLPCCLDSSCNAGIECGHLHTDILGLVESSGPHIFTAVDRSRHYLAEISFVAQHSLGLLFSVFFYDSFFFFLDELLSFFFLALLQILHNLHPTTSF
jgi:hypothetical protein